MSNNFGYIDIILLGMIAGFIILRLRSILGRKTGHEPKIYPNFAEKKFSVPNNDLKNLNSTFNKSNFKSITIKFFTEHYLRGCKSIKGELLCNKYDGELSNPRVGIKYLVGLLICKLNFLYLK